MKTLILYASKSGASEAYAHEISRMIPDSTVAMIDKTQSKLEGFDRIIIGSGVRMGKAYKEARTFMNTHLDSLLEKQTSVYFCNGFPETFQKSVNGSIPEKLKHEARAIICLLGKAPFQSSAKEDSEWMDRTALESFTQKIIAEG